MPDTSLGSPAVSGKGSSRPESVSTCTSATGSVSAPAPASGPVPEPASVAWSAPASADGPGCPSTFAPVEVSAQQLHELACQAFRIGNRGRLSLCEALRVLSETRLYLELGFPSLPAYADTFFQLRRAETFEYVRVANRLVELTELREVFGQGRLSWNLLKAITRVASVGSQRSWIDFVRENSVERTLAEARDALRRDRDAPRESSFGLPNLDQKLVLRFSRSDMDKVRRWIESTCARVAEKTGAIEVSVEQALLFVCEKGSTESSSPEIGPPSPLQGAAQNKDPCRSRVSEASHVAPGGVSTRAQIVYQRCPDCRRARVGTPDGFVEVAPEEVELHEGCAEPVVIDGPTPTWLRRRILAREAGLCGNPRCHHRAEHCHHIIFRSQGGRTALSNEVAVCATCHALVHAGLLRVRATTEGESRWEPVTSDVSLGRTAASNGSAADRLPVLRIQVAGAGGHWVSRADLGIEESAGADSKRNSVPESGGADYRQDSAWKSPVADPIFGPTPESADADSLGVFDSNDHARAIDGWGIDDLAPALIRLGVSAARSRKLLGSAIKGMERNELTVAKVLRRAISAI